MLSDKEIVRSILAGNKEAYSYLVNKYKNMVFSICYRILENKEEAEDISQEVFVKAFFSLNKHKIQETKFSNWIYRIAYTTSISKKRKFRLQKIDIEELDNEKNEHFDFNNAFLDIEERDRKQIIRNTIDKLKHDERLIIHMYYYMNCSITEISFITNQSNAYIKLRLHRLRGKMRQLLTPFIDYKTI